MGDIMKKMVFLFALGVATVASATSSVAVSSLDVDADRRLATVEYTLSGNAAIITAQFLLDGEAIDEKYYANVVGDVNQLVQPTGEGETRRIYWQQDKLWENRSGEGVLSVKLSAYTKSSPPDYMVFDILGSTNSPYASIRFYTSTNALPGGIGDISYRKEKIVFRRIPAANVVWKMGSPEDELGRSTEEGRETLHRVKLTSDYYMAVFETTHGQSKYLFRGTSYPTPADNSLNKDGDPTYAQGSVAFSYFKKPETDEAVDYLLIGNLRKRTGILFDLPTEAQWEYACRAGSGTSLNNNQNINNSNTSMLTRSMGWIFYKAGDIAEDGYPYGPRPVGLKIPNAWGLYDMHGNVAELCRDAAYMTYPSDDKISENPVCVDYDSSKKRIRRGGYFSTGANGCRSASRSSESNSGAYRGFGFRLIAPIPLD